jgi:hypothetical protein
LALLVLAVFMSLSCLAAGAYASEGDWNGGYDEGDVDLAWFTENQDASEFYIGTAKELAGLAVALDSGSWAYELYPVLQGGFADTTVYLTADIDLAAVDGVYWRPMGDIARSGAEVMEPNQGTYFKGAFDGGGHAVRYISDPDDEVGGLFSVLHAAGTIKNLAVDARIATSTDVNSGARLFAGGIALKNYGGVISDCFVSADISSSVYIGGIVVGNYGTIRNCAVSGNLSLTVLNSHFFLQAA